VTDADANAKVQALKGVADDLGCSLSQLAIAWCAANPNVSTVILGASRVEQLRENLGAIDVLGALDEDRMAQIEEVMAR
jgi:aryl-alcohol dehydrogenase-like predicted oxidoreductase